MWLVHLWWDITSTTNAFYGVVSGWLGDVGLASGIILYYRHKNCHVKGCPWLGKHPVAGGKYVVCGRHHPEIPEHITHYDVVKAHKVYTESIKD